MQNQRHKSQGPKFYHHTGTFCYLFQLVCLWIEAKLTIVHPIDVRQTEHSCFPSVPAPAPAPHQDNIFALVKNPHNHRLKTLIICPPVKTTNNTFALFQAFLAKKLEYSHRHHVYETTHAIPGMLYYLALQPKSKSQPIEGAYNWAPLIQNESYYSTQSQQTHITQ